ncbi:hypothetical protein [Trujillonella humicola]|uniref:hypothetical protein n=1 Tax=Trujillonella humicola TaxID=3383699 RepID=UPI003905F7C9
MNVLLLVPLLVVGASILVLWRPGTGRRGTGPAAARGRRARTAVAALAAALTLVLAVPSPALAEEPPAGGPATEPPSTSSSSSAPDEVDGTAPTTEADPPATGGVQPAPAEPADDGSGTGVAPTTSPPEPAEPAAEEPDPWTVTDPTVFGVGDSLFHQCGSSLGVPDRSLGMVGWWGGTTTDLRLRLTTASGTWPFTTEPSHAEELRDFRAAGTWVIGLGTNDVRFLGLGEYRANVEWFLQQSAGRPVLWLDVHNAGHPAEVAAFNAVLHDAATRWPNLRVLPWNRFVAEHPGAVAADGVHLSGYDLGCRQGRFALVRAALPQVAGSPDPSPPVAEPAPATGAAAAVSERAAVAGGALGSPTSGLVCGLKDGGCLQTYTGGVVTWSAGTGAHALTGRFAETWRANSADLGPLGYPVAEAVCGLPQGGCRQEFRGGTMLSSPAGGTWFAFHPLLAAWTAAGGPAGELGYPTSNSSCALRGGGCYQSFQSGSIHWSPATGVHVSRGAIAQRWAASGWETGRLGYPTSGIACGLRGGGCYQSFQGGTVHWSPASGAHITSGAIHQRWAAHGWETGRLGYPIGEVTCGLREGGCFQTFQGGVVHSSPATGAQVTWGAIHQRWAAQGWETGRLGYPTSGENCGLRGGGCYQIFQGGTVHWSPASGAHVTWGAIHQRWAAQGWETGRLGYPTSGEHCGLRGGGCFQTFQGGIVHWSPATGAQISWGAIYQRWAASGWETGRLGYPTSGEHCGLRGGGCFQTFQGGVVHWSPASGAHATWGAIHQHWAVQGWETGRLGYPLGGEYAVRGGWAQRFQGGTVSWVDGRIR